MRKWFKRLDQLCSLRQSRRLEDRIYSEILVKGEAFQVENKDDYKEGIELFGELLMAHSEHAEENGLFGDMFGEYLAENNSLNARAGQFFTPITLCDAMVEMLLSVEKVKGEPQKILDPASGCARFMLRTAKWYAEKVGQFNFIFYNIDIDFRMYVYGCMNAILHAIPSVNAWGNTLLWEFREGLVTIPIGRIAHWKRLDAEQIKEWMGTPPGQQTLAPKAVRSTFKVIQPPAEKPVPSKLDKFWE